MTLAEMYRKLSWIGCPPYYLFQGRPTAGNEPYEIPLILNYPSNPTGVSYAQEELKALAEVLRRYEVIVLSDEIYGQLHYRGQHASIARYYPEGAIISSGLSKWCGAGGWRPGTFSFPPDLDWLCHAMPSVASETFTTVRAPIQHAAVHAFNGGPAIQAYLSKARRVLEALASYAVATLRRAGIAVHQPDGAFYLFPDFSSLADKLAARGITDSRALCSDLLERASVAALPGAAFGRSRNCLAARLAFVDSDGAEALCAVEQIPEGQPLSTHSCALCAPGPWMGWTPSPPGPPHNSALREREIGF